MPVVKVTKVTVTHVWDDNSETDVEISMKRTETAGPHVQVSCDNQVIAVHPDSWEEIKAQIDTMIDDINLDRANE